ncbi:MAG TPA: hypothetical protein VFM30_09875 [Steroidobacteraceae bacterium]|jgi:hypothetical protein|nr:hypothetical protein [Steroidobacteraceae bacterium]
MKRTPLYRAPLAGLMSLAILASPLPPSALADPPSRPDKPDEKKPPGEKDKSQPKKQAKRVSREQQEERIRRQQAQLQVYRQNIALREKVAERDEQILRQQKRIAHLRFQQAYRQRLQQQRTALVSARYDYYEDPFFYTGPSYRYRRDGRYYMTNEIGMEALKQALNQGYKEGVRAGRADREDEWRFDPRSSFAYQDAYYGYDGRHLEQDEYQHYFREGFERGYEDGYYGRRKYGSGGDDDDEWWIAAGVVAAVLAYQALDD